MITKDKVTEIFCIIDEFDKNLNVNVGENFNMQIGEEVSAV